MAFAQSPSPLATPPPLPPGPLVQKRAPDFARWVIRPAAAPAKTKPGHDQKSAEATTGEKDAQGNPVEKPVQTVTAITKTGKILLRQKIVSQRPVSNTWCVEDFQTTISPDAKNWMMQSRNADPNVGTADYEDYSQTDFPEFQWISLKSYAGIAEFGGKQCILYRSSIKSDIEGAPDTAVAAYVDLETRLPVAVNTGGEAHMYEFKEPPTAMLTIPPLIQELLDNRNKLMQSACRRLPAR